MKDWKGMHIVYYIMYKTIITVAYQTTRIWSEIALQHMIGFELPDIKLKYSMKKQGIKESQQQVKGREAWRLRDRDSYNLSLPHYVALLNQFHHHRLHSC